MKTKIRLLPRHKRQVVDVLEMDEEAMTDIIKVFIQEERHFECYKDGVYYRILYWHEGRLKNVLIRLRGEE